MKKRKPTAADRDLADLVRAIPRMNLTEIEQKTAGVDCPVPPGYKLGDTITIRKPKPFMPSV
jgi:hypothetical protein